MRAYKWLAVLMFMLAMCGMAVTVLGQTAAYSVTFTVTDDEGNGLPDSTVRFDGEWHPCDENGRVDVSTERGTHEWVANAPGREVRRGSVEVDGDERVDVRLSVVEHEGEDDWTPPESSAQDQISAALKDETCCAVTIILLALVLFYALRRMGLI